jgi:hypothetical protein
VGSSCITDYIALDWTTVSEKYLRKLIGKADIEDALKRLDKLTQEEARMATTQVLKATRSVDDRVAGVDGRVKAIDGKVAKILDGTRTIFSQLPKNVWSWSTQTGIKQR